MATECQLLHPLEVPIDDEDGLRPELPELNIDKIISAAVIGAIGALAYDLGVAQVATSWDCLLERS